MAWRGSGVRVPSAPLSIAVRLAIADPQSHGEAVGSNGWDSRRWDDQACDRVDDVRVRNHAPSRLLADVETRGLAIELVPRPPARSLAEAAQGLGIEPARLVKTLVLKGRQLSGQGERFWFVLVPGDRQIVWPALRSLLGVNKLALPPADVAYAATGYERGTITPLGSTTAWPVVVDQRILGHRVALGSGAHDQAVFVDADGLVAAYDATVADISEALPADDATTSHG